MAQMLTIFCIICATSIVNGWITTNHTIAYPKSSPRANPMVLQTPQQVRISLSKKNMMRITWVTVLATPSTVYYGTFPGRYTSSAKGSTNMYSYMTYTSGEIHDVVIGPLILNTIYYYRCGTNSSKEFSFKTPPDAYPFKFAVAGDLGQSHSTQSTLQHISESKYDVLLLPGDLSYADRYQPRWDAFGYMVEPLASKRPWMVTQGNHDDESIIKLHSKRFTAYNARWVMPYKESGSSSNLYYSFDVFCAHIIMLGSYTAFGNNSAQYRWLLSDLRKVDRNITPWLVVAMHAPWYNSNSAHQNEKESVGMRAAMEDVLYKARVDVVLAGHVHAYERFARVFKNRADKCGPMYITVGDGGNRQKLANRFMDPQPKLSTFREPSFGHGQLTILNATHSVWTWHRNQDNVAVTADKVLIKNLASDTLCKRA